MNKMKQVILDKDGYGYYALVVSENGVTPYPLLGRVQKFVARHFLPIAGVRGVNWFFECPYCGHKDFYSNDICPECTVTREGQVTDHEEYFRVAVLPRIREFRWLENTLQELRELENLDGL